MRSRPAAGNDGPEASTEGLYVSAAGTCSTGAGFGGACFRDASHPIIVHVTDAEFHNGPSGANAYSGVAGAHTWTEMDSTAMSTGRGCAPRPSAPLRNGGATGST